MKVLAESFPTVYKYYVKSKKNSTENKVTAGARIKVTPAVYRRLNFFRRRA